MKATAVSWLDWKLGARLLLKYPALTIVGGLSLAAAIAIGAAASTSPTSCLYKRLPFDGGSRIVRLETQDAAALRVEPRVLHDFAIWRQSLKTVAELGAARLSERNVPPLLGPLQPTHAQLRTRVRAFAAHAGLSGWRIG